MACFYRFFPFVTQINLNFLALHKQLKKIAAKHHLGTRFSTWVSLWTTIAVRTSNYGIQLMATMT